MPETATAETRGEKILGQFYQGKLAERLMQAASMEQNRSLLRRGARKMQDGTLGTSDGDDLEEEPVNIHIGDHITQAPPAVQPTANTQAATPAASTVSAGTPLWQKALLSAAMLASGAGAGAGVPWLLGAFDKPAAVQPATPSVDTDTQYQLSITPEAAK